MYLQVVLSEVGKPSTDLQRSHASLHQRLVNRAVQHLMGFRLTPGASPAAISNELTSCIFIYMCFLLINDNKGVARLCKIKKSFSYIFWITLID